MYRILLSFVILLAGGWPALLSAQTPYVDPLLTHLLRPEVRRSLEQLQPLREPLPPGEQPMTRVVALDWEGPQGSPRVGMLVKLRGPQALAELRAAGAEIGSVQGDIATARVPLASLDPLTRSQGFLILEAARPVERDHDVSMAAINVEGVRTRVGNSWQGFAGQGVAVGIVDTGLDYRHPDFRDEQGATRVLALWDQTIAQGTRPPGFAYGHLCTAASLTAQTCPQIDRDGHGTHVAGSAAGNGAATATANPAFQYPGVAPAADLLIVKALFFTDRILDGVRWILSEAERTGRPAVVNLSLGTDAGPHDGTSLFDQALDQASGAGRIVVTSSGNSGDNRNTSPGISRARLHAMGMPAVGATTELTFQVPAYTPATPSCEGNIVINNFALMELWYRGTDRLDIGIFRPDGSGVVALHGQSVADNGPEGGIQINNAAAGPHPLNQDFQALIFIHGCNPSGPPAAGTWTIGVTPTQAASGQSFHLWITSSIFGAAGPARGLLGFTNSHLVSSPGTALEVLTAGAFVTRLCWPAMAPAGQHCWRDLFGWAEEVGDIAYFSSGGPTRDGRVKPEISAPGRMIISSLSAQATPDLEGAAAFVHPNRLYWALQGTSMSSPHVAGAVALMLQVDPALTPTQARNVLAATARSDVFTARSYVTGDPGGRPNFQWGHGKLDVRAALDALGAFADVSTVVVDAAALPAPEAPLSERGTRLALVQVTLTVEGPEAVNIEQLSFDAVGNDPTARVLVFRDLAGNGQLDAGDPLIGSLDAPLAPRDTVRLRVPTTLRVEAGEVVHLIAALEMGGGAPHEATFFLRFVPGETRGRGVQSARISPLRLPDTPIAGPVVRTTVLRADEVFALSENPIRSQQVILNFRTRPQRILAVYNLSGRQVVNLLPRLQTGVARVVWDLTNEQGSPVAPGVYLLVADVGDRIIRERLIIVRPGGGQ